MKNDFFMLLRNNYALFVLIVISFFIYMPGLSGDFVWDDIFLVKDNHYLSIGNTIDFFTKGMIENTESQDNTIPLYRPMVLVVFSLLRHLWGNGPAAFHVLLLILHLTNVVLVYCFIRKVTTESFVAATFGAAMFALHPARVESVAWISGIPDPLVLFFLFGAMFAHISFTEKPNRWRYFFAALILFQMALWSKEVAILFPLVVLAYEQLYRKKINFQTTLIYVALAGVYLIARGVVLGASDKLNALSIPQPARIAEFILEYGQLLLLPFQLPYDLQIPENPVYSLLSWISVSLIASVTIFSWRCFKSDRRKTLVFSIIWIFVFFWPAVVFAIYMNGYAARYLYVPAVGAAVFASSLYGYVSEKSRILKACGIAFSTVVIIIFGTLSWREIPSWKDDGAFFSKVIIVSPENVAAYRGAGNFHLNRNDYTLAEKYFLMSLQKANTNQDRASAMLALGTTYGIDNKLELSEYYFVQSLKYSPNNSDSFMGLGNLALVRNRFPEAIYYYEKAVASRPNNIKASMNLAIAYEKIGDFDRSQSIKSSLKP